MVTEASRLRGDGVEVTLADGTTDRLVFDFDALAELESEFGTLLKYSSLLREEWGGPVFRVVRAGVRAGLMHTERDEVPLDSKAVNGYLLAINEALAQAMPDTDDAPPKAKGSRGRSRGNTSTTSRPSPTDAVTGSSGA